MATACSKDPMMGRSDADRRAAKSTAEQIGCARADTSYLGVLPGEFQPPTNIPLGCRLNSIPTEISVGKSLDSFGDLPIFPSPSMGVGVRPQGTIR